MAEVRLDQYPKLPELKQILNDFTSNLLLQKPDDVYSFAHSYFSTFHHSTTNNIKKGNSNTLQPVVITGPSGVGKGTCKWFPLDLFVEIGCCIHNQQVIIFSSPLNPCSDQQASEGVP